MENQEITTPAKSPPEKNSLLSRLRTNKITPLILAGGVLFGSESAAVSPKPELKKMAQSSALLKLMQDPTVKRQEIRAAVETFFDLRGDHAETDLLSVLKKTELDYSTEESIVDALQDRIIKSVHNGEDPSQAMKTCLDLLSDTNTDPAMLSRVLTVVGWRAVREEMKIAGWGTDKDGKPFIIKGKNTPTVFTHVDLSAVSPLMINLLDHNNETVRSSVRHELIGIILFCDKDGTTLENIRHLSHDATHPLQQQEAQSIISFIDQLDTQLKEKKSQLETTPEEQLNEEQSLTQEVPSNEYDKWIKILNDTENTTSEMRREALQALIKLGGGPAVRALADIAEKESWARGDLFVILGMRNLGEKNTKRAQVAHEALLQMIGPLLKNSPEDAFDFLGGSPLYYYEGISTYTPELLEAYFSLGNDFDKTSMAAEFFNGMPKADKKAAIQQVLAALQNPDPVRKADAMDLLEKIDLRGDEKKEARQRSHQEALNLLAGISNRANIDPRTKEKLLRHIAVDDPASEPIFNYLKSNRDAGVRRAAYDGLVKSGHENAIDEMLHDTDSTVRERGFFYTAKKVATLINNGQKYTQAAKPLYDALSPNTGERDDTVRAKIVERLTALDLPASEALFDPAAAVRMEAVWNVKRQLHNGDENARALLERAYAQEDDPGVRWQIEIAIKNADPHKR